MADADDLRLNTLHRFAKHSPRLVLEEHSHCEVPAGCGGVVLRWLDPEAGIDVVLSALTGGKVDAFLDGDWIGTGLRSMGFGEHVLALHLTDRAAEKKRAAARVLTVTGRQVRREERGPGPLVLASRDDGAWRYQEVEPEAADPANPGTGAGSSPDPGAQVTTGSSPPPPRPTPSARKFDDRQWPWLERAGAELAALPESDRQLHERVGAPGAIPLALPDGGRDLWIRVRFHIPRDAGAASTTTIKTTTTPPGRNRP